MKKALLYFVQGLVITVPVVITGYVIYKVIDWTGSLFNKFGTIVSPVVDPFIILLTAITLIFFMGMMGSSIVMRPLFTLLDKGFESAPLIKTVYTSIKDLLSAFVGNKKKFNKPVLVTINKENNIRQLGFITDEDLHELNVPKDMVAVYIPMSYSLSGNLIIVSSDRISPVDIASSEVMKYIVSGGVTDIDEKENK